MNDPHTEFNDLVTRYLSGELSPDELLHFREIIAGDQELKEQLDEYQKVWDSMDGVAGQHTYNLDREWDALRKKVPGWDDATAGGEVPFPGSGPGRSLLFYTYRIAAALLVGLLFAFAWVYTTRLAGTELVMAGSRPVELLLEDGSLIVLNRESKIRYQKHFTGSERQIRLTGEAWFDVARDTTKPFIIEAGTALVEVLGTSFNVNAYRENPTVEITVESGMVAVSARQDQQEQIVLRAGNSGTCDKNSRELQLVPTSDPNNLSWKTRDLYFENTSLEEVAALINRVYNTNLVIRNRELASCPITVTFRDQTLESVLNVLEMTLDLEISRSGNSIVLDGKGCIE